MKNSMSFVLSLLFISTLLFGCQSGDSNKIEQEKEVITKTDSDNVETNEHLEEFNDKLKLDGEISKVKIAKSKVTDSIIFSDEKSIEIFDSVFTSAVKESGIVNLANPANSDFSITVYTSESLLSFNLWLGEKGEKSTLMSTDDTHVIYTISEDMTDKLIDLIK